MLYTVENEKLFQTLQKFKGTMLYTVESEELFQTLQTFKGQ